MTSFWHNVILELRQNIVPRLLLIRMNERIQFDYNFIIFVGRKHSEAKCNELMNNMHKMKNEILFFFLMLARNLQDENPMLSVQVYMEPKFN